MADSPKPPGNGDAYDGLRQLRRELRKNEGGGAQPGPGGGDGGRRPGRPRRALRRWPRRTLITVNVVVALLLLGTAGTYGYVQWRLGQIKRVSVFGLQVTGHSSQSKSNGGSIPPFTLLVVGSDTRNLGAGSSPAFGNSGNSGVQGQRSDSIILMRVNPKYRAIGLLSIPRDTLEQVPGYGLTRVNTAFNTGNPNLLIQVLNQDFNIQVNHYAEFNFDTFRDVANAIGGVEQWFPAPGRDVNSDFQTTPAGCQNLSGNQALAFVRSRDYQYFLNGSWHFQTAPESDLARIQRQQSFVRDAIHKAKKVAPTNPVALNAVIGGITKNLTLDSGFSNSLLLNLAQRYLSANLASLPSWTYPTTNSVRQSGALDPLPQSDAETVQAWLNVGVPAPAPSATSTPSPATTTVSPSSVNIEVENGSGSNGQAATASGDLQKLGYKTTVNSAFSNFNHPSNVINYAPDSLAAAKQLQQQLNGGATLVEDNSLTPTNYNLLLITGQSYNGVSGGSASSSTTTTTPGNNPAINGSTTVSPDSSTIINGVYIPPGLQPGQTPQTCGE